MIIDIYCKPRTTKSTVSIGTIKIKIKKAHVKSYTLCFFIWQETKCWAIFWLSVIPLLNCTTWLFKCRWYEGMASAFWIVGHVAGGIIGAASSSRKKWASSMNWIRWSDEQELDVKLCYLATVLLVTIFRFIVILHSICWDVKVVEIFMHRYF
jgi:hypothetical protein